MREYLQDFIKPLSPFMIGEKVEISVVPEVGPIVFTLAFGHLTIDPDKIDPQVLLALNVIGPDETVFGVKDQSGILVRHLGRLFEQDVDACWEYFRSRQRDPNLNVREGIELLNIEDKEYEEEFISALDYASKLNGATSSFVVSVNSMLDKFCYS